jgi:hypothetical protein
MGDIGTHPIIDPRAVPEHVYAAAMRWFAQSKISMADLIYAEDIFSRWKRGWVKWGAVIPYSKVTMNTIAESVLSQAAEYGVARECKE